MDDISEILLNQRIRNRIIEVLQIYASLDNQKIFGSSEVVNLWDDWVDVERLKNYTEPVFSSHEQRGISEFHKNWMQICDNTPDEMPNIDELMINQEWLQLVNSAKEALTILMIRGVLSEDKEITSPL